MALTQQDLNAIRQLVNEAIDTRVPRIIDERVPKIIDERVPKIIDDQIQPMLDRLEKRLVVRIEQLTLDVGQFSLETTSNFMALEAHVEDLDDGLAKLYEMADNNRIELRKLKHRLKTA